MNTTLSMIPAILFFFHALLLTRTDGFSLPQPALTPKVKLRPGHRTFWRRVDHLLTQLQNPAAQLENHTYLSDNYAPVSTEYIHEPVSDVVYGQIPTDLRGGMLCRNGPNPAVLPRTKLYHWFDGDAMLHNLHFDKDGKAYYSNQFVPSIRYQIEQGLQEQFYPTLGEYTGFWGLLKLLFHPAMVNHYSPDFGLTSSPPNTACLMYRHKFYCLNEANVPFECRILPDGSIRAVGYEYFDHVHNNNNNNATTFRLDYPVSAHPRIDPVTGDLFFHSYSVGTDQLQKDGPMKIGRYSAHTDRVEAYFGLHGPQQQQQEQHVSFAHNLLVTANHVIVYDCSVHFSPAALFEGGSFFRTNPDHTLRFGVMPKTATSANDVVWFDAGVTGGIVHPLNAWHEEMPTDNENEKGTIVIWTPFCPNLVLDLETDEINRFAMVEFRIDLTTGRVHQTVIDDSLNVEFSVVPTMGQFTRFGYTAIQDPSTPGEGSFTGFCVWDMLKKRLHATVYYDGVGGEPMVLQASPKRDGKVYIGAYVQKDDKSYFELYDGESTELVCRMRMPARIPFGFHGLWISEEELQGHFEYHEEGDRETITDASASEAKTASPSFL